MSENGRSRDPDAYHDLEWGSTPPSASGNLPRMQEARRWQEFGQYLVEQRERLGLKRREAAKRARVTESEWRTLELGYREEFGGVRVLPNPSADVLARIAKALELTDDVLLEHVGPRNVRADHDGEVDAHTHASALARRIDRLRPEDRRLVELFVERLLREA